MGIFDAEYGAVREAKMRLNEAVAQRLPAGTTVYWYHGKTLRSAPVVRTYQERVVVEGVTGARYGIGAAEIVRAGPSPTDESEKT